MSDKKVLIIAYYWPPSGGSGVQRWLKFVKYLPHFGWQPFVFTPENPSFDVKDESLLADVPVEAEVIRFPIWEPYETFFRLSSITGEKQKAKPTALIATKKQSIFQRVSTWIRGNLIIPDPRVFWVRPSTRFLADFIRDNKIRTIVTTGPPHSLHLIGYRLRKKIPSLRWIADFRDPWSEWGLLDSLSVGNMARTIHRKLELKVLRTADAIVTVTPQWVRMFERLSGRKVWLITNGFDETDFENFKVVKTDKFIIRHVGTVNEKCDPRPFMQAVKVMLDKDPLFATKVQIDFVGEVHMHFKEFVASIPALKTVTTFTPSVPHKSLMSMYANSSLLLLILTGYKNPEEIVPGKLFEYIATRLPIMGVGPPEGDASTILQHVEHQKMIDGADEAGIIQALTEQFQKWQEIGSLTRSTAIDAYSRKSLTMKLIELL